MNNEVETTDHSTQVRHFINAHKIATPLVVISMMSYFEFWGTTAWVYLALHSTYCLLWMILYLRMYSSILFSNSSGVSYDLR
jgi:hypothetical protein